MVKVMLRTGESAQHAEQEEFLTSHDVNLGRQTIAVKMGSQGCRRRKCRLAEFRGLGNASRGPIHSSSVTRAAATKEESGRIGNPSGRW